MDVFNWRNIQGWFSEADASFVSNICQEIYSGKIVEIGCFKGRSTAVMMPIAIKNNNSYFVIDNFYGGVDLNDEASRIQRSEGKKIMEEFIINMKLIGFSELDYKLLKENSIDASIHFIDKSIDMIFIDGDHDLSEFKKELPIWWKKIKDNGIISGHDYQFVGEIVYSFGKEYNLKLNRGGNSWSLS